MQVRTLAVVAVALLVALSGCAAFEGVTSDGSTNETDGEDETEIDFEDAAESGDDETDTEETGSVDDQTATAEWRPPEEPNRPLENKREDRIENVSFVDREPAADGEGYSNFNLEVVANTSMKNVDPPEHGDVVGEPYFFVKINEGPGDRKIVERTGQVRMDENGTYHIDVRPAGIEEFGEGSLTVEVFLMDEDKDWDDIYDAVARDIHFNPATDGDTADDESVTAENESETDDTESETDGETDEDSDAESETEADADAESETDGAESETDDADGDTDTESETDEDA